MASLRFIDPVFTSEVVLTGPAMELYEAARPQFERLRGIKELGIIAHTSDTAFHTRHNHLVGLLRIFNKLCQQPKGAGLPKKFLWSFWCRLCFGQVGHAALSYDTEKAVLLACQVDTNFRDRFVKFLQPVLQQIKPCHACNTSSSCRMLDHDQAQQWLNHMIDGFEWRHIHLWVAALKLAQSPCVLDVLRKQVVSSTNTVGFAEVEAYKILVCPSCEWDTRIHRLNRLDYVIRDLALTGRVNIQLDVDGIIAAANNSEYQDWELLRSLDGYLTATLYGETATQTVYALLQRAIADLLINDEVWIWGATTTTSDPRSKRNSDFAKIQNLVERLHHRWDTDIKIVQNYICKDGAEISCDIDGVLSKRTA